MGSYEGYIGIRTNSKRLYLDICRKTDTEFGSRSGDVWQVTFQCNLDEQEMVSKINEYLGMAQSDENVIACGYTIYSVTDRGTYFRYLGDKIYSWSDIMLRYFSDNSESEEKTLWKVAMRRKLAATKRFMEICTESASVLKAPDEDSFTRDGSWWSEKRAIEKAKRVRNAQPLYKEWQGRMIRMLDFVRSKAEKPFGRDKLTRMHVLTWFKSDPNGLISSMRKYDMTWYFLPYVYDQSAEWVILQEDNAEILDIAPTEFDELDMREVNLKHLAEELERPGHHIHVCTYKDACSAMKLEDQPDEIAIDREDRKRLRKTGFTEDTGALYFEGKRIGFLDERYNALYAAMLVQKGEAYFITNETAVLVGAESIDLNTEYNEDFDLSELDYIVIGPETYPENELFEKAAGIRKRKGKPVILLESDYLMRVSAIIDEKQKNAVRLAHEASVFDPARYDYPGCANVMKRAKTTVGAPIDVNKKKNTCRFISTGSGEEYFTSLSVCTCPAYLKSKEQRPCKHMFRLALELEKIK